MISYRLKQLRKSKGLSQKQIANYLGITPTAYCYYEQGKRHPDTNTIVKLSNFYNVSTDYIIGKTTISAELPQNIDISLELDALINKVQTCNLITFDSNELDSASKVYLINSLNYLKFIIPAALSNEIEPSNKYIKHESIM